MEAGKNIFFSQLGLDGASNGSRGSLGFEKRRVLRNLPPEGGRWVMG